MICLAAMPGVLMRSVPAARPVAAIASATAASISCIIGSDALVQSRARSRRRDASRRAIEQATPSRASSWRIVWLSAEAESPR